MSFTNKDWLPGYAELDVQEVDMSSAPLRAGSHHFGHYCDEPSKEFMLCFQEEKDPRKCLNEGKEVTRCAVQFFQKMKENCAAEFTKYWKCIDHSGYEMDFKGCRKTQKVFDKCVFDSLGQERPGLGYFSRRRIHYTDRPRPTRDVPLPEGNPIPPDPKEHEAPESAKTGHRYM